MDASSWAQWSARAIFLKRQILSVRNTLPINSFLIDLYFRFRSIAQIRVLNQCWTAQIVTAPCPHLRPTGRWSEMLVFAACFVPFWWVLAWIKPFITHLRETGSLFGMSVTNVHTSASISIVLSRLPICIKPSGIVRQVSSSHLQRLVNAQALCWAVCLRCRSWLCVNCGLGPVNIYIEA